MQAHFLSRRFSIQYNSMGSQGAGLSSAQVSMDAMMNSFVDQATDPKMLAAMIGGGFAFRFARIGTSSLAFSAMSQGKGLLPILARGSSYATALASESLAFTAIHRSLNDHSNENFNKEWIHNTISLGSLKIFAHFSSRQNIVFQHFFTDAGMLTAHRLAVLARLEPASSESLVEQFIRAEAMHWQMKAGMALTYRLMPGIARYEKSLDLTLHSQIQRNPFVSRERVLFSELPVMSAAEPLHARVKRYKRRANHSASPLVTGAVIDIATRARARADQARRASGVSGERRKWLEQLPYLLRVKAEKWGKGYGVVFLPGMYNHPPDPAWMNLISSAFEHGGVMLSTAVSADRLESHELYATLGENKRVLQPHWEMEIPIVMRRLAVALRDPNLLGSAEKLVLIGHSKGGLLAHALKALQKVYAENGGVIPKKIIDLYPGLEGLSDVDLHQVMSVLEKSKMVLLGSPVEGIDYNFFIEVADHLLLEGSAQGFDRERLPGYFQTLGFGPEIADLIVHAQMPGLLRSLLHISHPGNTLDSLTYRTTGIFFYGISFVMNAREGDALVRAYKRYSAQFLRGRYNHVDMIVDPAAALDLLDLVFNHIETPQNSF